MPLSRHSEQDPACLRLQVVQPLLELHAGLTLSVAHQRVPRALLWNTLSEWQSNLRPITQRRPRVREERLKMPRVTGITGGRATRIRPGAEVEPDRTRHDCSVDDGQAGQLGVLDAGDLGCRHSNGVCQSLLAESEAQSGIEHFVSKGANQAVAALFAPIVSSLRGSHAPRIGPGSYRALTAGLTATFAHQASTRPIQARSFAHVAHFHQVDAGRARSARNQARAWHLEAESGSDVLVEQVWTEDAEPRSSLVLRTFTAVARRANLPGSGSPPTRSSRFGSRHPDQRRCRR